MAEREYREYSAGGVGDVYRDRLFSEYPVLRGHEVKEDGGGGYEAPSQGDVFEDRLFSEHPVLRGHEVKEEEGEES
jgi:hypothetical protein